MKNHLIILAAGKGTRMKSDQPKVLTSVKGIPIIKRLLNNLKVVCENPTIIVGYKNEEVIRELGDKYHYVVQTEQKGTGHAILSTKKDLSNRSEIESIIVVPGDHPLIDAETIRKIINYRTECGATIALVTINVPPNNKEWEIFTNYGRVIRDKDNTVLKIVEYRDASENERKIREVNPSYYCFDAGWLWDNIDLIDNRNAAGEYYLTDIVGIARKQKKVVVAQESTTLEEGMGINTPEQLKLVEDLIDLRGDDKIIL